MKILYIHVDHGIPILGDKGASVHVRAFISAATALGHDVVLACATLGAGNPPPPARIIQISVESNDATLAGECAACGVPAATLADPLLRREIERLAYDRALPSRLIAELDANLFRPDIIYERHALFHQAGTVIATALGVPRLLEVNAPLVAEQARYRGLRLVDAALAAEAASYRGADAIIAVSEAVAAHVRSVIGATEQVHVIPNGVDLAQFSLPNHARNIRSGLGIGAGPVIGFIGSFKPWHGMGFLLDAFEILAAKRPEVSLIAVGDGPDLPAARARAAESGLARRVFLPGRIAHASIPSWLNAMDMTVAPYLPQPDFYFSPLKIVESLAAGKPVVAPRIGQIPDLVADGDTGLLFPPGDAVAFGHAMCTLIDDPDRRLAMGQAARRLAAGRGWSAVVRRVLELAPAHRSERAA
jgi:glycosyltransferase involved in cell wall biosynthesis